MSDQGLESGYREDTWRKRVQAEFCRFSGRSVGLVPNFAKYYGPEVESGVI